MAEPTVKESLDGVVKAIGFGIVGDFRELYDAMRNVSADIRAGNETLTNVNRNAEQINKALDDFATQRFRDKTTRATRQAEDKLEGRVRLNAQRSEESMQKIQKTLEVLLREVKMGGANQSSQGGGFAEAAAGAAVGAAAGGAGGSFLKGAAKVAKVGAMLAGATAIGAAGAYLLGSGETSSESGGSLGPAAGPAGSQGVPTTAADITMMGGAAAATGAAVGAAALVGRSTMSAKQKALSKVAPKVPSYLSKFGTRIATTIGLKSIPVFGALVGGYFSFSRFMSGDSWQAIGYEFASGVAPPVGALGGPAGYVAGVSTTIAIQTYLICRDIYQEENATDIKNNVVPNFDDLEWSERVQVLNAVKGYVETYINGLIGRSKTSDATKASSMSTSGAALGGSTLGGEIAETGAGTGAALAGAAATGGDSGSGMTGAGGETGEQQTQSAPPATGGITTTVAQDIASQRAEIPEGQIPETTAQQNTFMDRLVGASQPPMTPMIGASPNDSIATFDTTTDLSSMYTGSGSLEELKAEIARGEGDYASYNRGVAGDTPAGNRTIDIQNLTVAEVLDLQRQRQLFAVGKYQFIPGTLREAVAYTGIDTSRKFDATTQEQLFPYLISDAKRPKLAGYISGRHDNVDSALNDLAAEFASIPQSNGRGRYDGDSAGNRAAGGLQRAAKIKAILQGMRQSGNQATAPQEITAMASGGVVTPLPSDNPKAGRDLSSALQPPSTVKEKEMEDEFSTSERTIDARKKAQASPNGKEKKKNSIASYTPYMSYLFGSMTEELRAHTNGEVTADRAFKEVMDPLS